MLEREKHNREQMDMIYRTIISQGLASKDQIVFVHGRGKELNPSTFQNSYLAGNFKMYGPYTRQGRNANFQRAPSPNSNGNLVGVESQAIHSGRFREWGRHKDKYTAIYLLFSSLGLLTPSHLRIFCFKFHNGIVCTAMHYWQQFGKWQLASLMAEEQLANIDCKLPLLHLAMCYVVMTRTVF